MNKNHFESEVCAMSIVLSVIALCYMLSVAVLLAVRYCRADRTKKYAQLKNFRKGVFGLIYFGAVPLYLVGHLFNGAPWFNAILNSISGAFSLMVLSFDWNTVTPLMREELFYKIAVYACFSSAVFNATMIAQRLYESGQITYMRTDS